MSLPYNHYSKSYKKVFMREVLKLNYTIKNDIYENICYDCDDQS